MTLLRSLALAWMLALTQGWAVCFQTLAVPRIRSEGLPFGGQCSPPSASMAGGIWHFRWAACKKCLREVTRDRVLCDRRIILST